MKNPNPVVGGILSAGPLHPTLTQIFGHLPAGLIPINGRPCIFYILDQMIKLGINEVFITVGVGKEPLIKKVTEFYGEKLKIRYVETDPRGGAGNALLELIVATGFRPLFAVLGDTVVTDSKTDFHTTSKVWVSDDYEDTDKWCVVSTRGSLVDQIYDKQELDKNGKLCLVGQYYFATTDIFQSYRPTKSRLEISDLLQHLKLTKSIEIQATQGWIDVGHIEKYQMAKGLLLQTRFFNSLTFDRLLGTITKRSTKSEKFADEIRWYLNLPSHLKILAPRILGYNITGRNYYATMEYYGYPTVAELWLYSDIDTEIFKSIINRLFDILSLFQNESREVSRADYEDIYWHKTVRRLDELRGHGDWDRLFNAAELTINNKPYLGLPTLLPLIKAAIPSLFDENDNCLIHGDFCFSNILYDMNSGTVRLLDPRGRWGKTAYGDLKYDLAKLRHSICGRYDFLTNGFFSVEETNDASIAYHIKSDLRHDAVAEHFDAAVSGFADLSKIKLIEGLLFLSMLPLHADKPSAQKVMFAKSIELLNGSVAHLKLIKSA